MIINRRCLVADENFSEAQGLLDAAIDEARARGAATVGTEHLLLALLSSRDTRIAEFVHRYGITRQSIEAVLDEARRTGRQEPDRIPLSPRAQAVLSAAEHQRKLDHAATLDAWHFWSALLRQADGMAAVLLTRLGVPLPRSPEDREDEVEPPTSASGEQGRRESRSEPLAEWQIVGKRGGGGSFASKCPRCDELLAITIGQELLEIRRENVGIPVRVFYCRKCGHALSVLAE
jgi:ATP-dependent Clp protease ATP-binding subunit ClpA